VLPVAGIGNRGKECFVAWLTADVFRWTRIFSGRAYDGLPGDLRRDELLDSDPVLPVVAEIVQVGEIVDVIIDIRRICALILWYG
jgi:hypothetical protein